MFESSRTTPLVFYRVGIFVWSVVCLVIFFKLSAFCSASLDGFSVLFSKRCFYFLEIEHIYIFEQSVKYTINDIQHILSIDAKTVLDCFTKVYFSIVHSDWSTTHIEEMIAISWCVIKNHPQFMIKESSVTKCSVDAIQSFAIGTSCWNLLQWEKKDFQVESGLSRDLFASTGTYVHKNLAI